MAVELLPCFTFLALRLVSPKMDLPFLVFIGAWFLLFSFDIAGGSGLIFPGVAGWVLLIIALARVLSTMLRRRSFVPRYAS
ncbi:MAG: hypothetical protein ABSG88_08585 [Bradyrhizobium sp.]